MTTPENLKDGGAIPEQEGVEFGVWRPEGGLKAKARRGAVILHSSTWPRRFVPTRVAYPLIEAFGAHCQRQRNAMFEDNVKYHRQLWQYTPLLDAVDDIARKAIIEYFECVEIFWRPWLADRGTVEGMDHYREARAAGRGVVCALPHFSMIYAHCPIMRRFGLDAWAIASAHHFTDQGAGYDGRFARHGKKYLDALGPDHLIARQRMTDGRSVFEMAHDLLCGGATVIVAFDVAGSLPTPFLGRQVSLASGSAKLALGSDALVVPMVVRRNRQHPILRFDEAIDPREFEDPTALQAAIARVMERWALEEPWAVWSLHTQPGGPPLIQGPQLAEVA